MSIDLRNVQESIRDRLPDLQDLSDRQRSDETLGGRIIRELSLMDLDQFSSHLPDEPKGAIPILEGNESPSDWDLLRPFNSRFQDRTEATEWARTILDGRTVGAVDGSQIYPGGEFTVPIGLVNIGWYVNHHDGKGTYDRDHTTSLLLPDDLGFTPDSGVNLHREEGEISKLIELHQSAGPGGSNSHINPPAPLFLLDGSLVLSFALHVFESTRKRYISGILRLLDAVSQEDGPLFAAYVDTTRATDLATMLSGILAGSMELKRRIFGEVENEEWEEIRWGEVEWGGPPQAEVTGLIRDGGEDRTEETGPQWRPRDAILLSDGLREWGDRTSAFVCARDNILDLYKDGDRDHSRSVAFFYMKTSHHRVSRVEFPVSIVRSARVEELADVIRAQLIVGKGYVHVLDRAHHEANVTTKDRERFLRIIQLTAREHDLAIGTSLKAASKR
jgi:hypothetical protein